MVGSWLCICNICISQVVRVGWCLCVWFFIFQGARWWQGGVPRQHWWGWLHWGDTFLLCLHVNVSTSSYKHTAKCDKWQQPNINNRHVNIFVISLNFTLYSRQYLCKTCPYSPGKHFVRQVLPSAASGMGATWTWSRQLCPCRCGKFRQKWRQFWGCLFATFHANIPPKGWYRHFLANFEQDFKHLSFWAFLRHHRLISEGKSLKCNMVMLGLEEAETGHCSCFLPHPKENAHFWLWYSITFGEKT